MGMNEEPSAPPETMVKIMSGTVMAVVNVIEAWLVGGSTAPWMATRTSPRMRLSTNPAITIAAADSTLVRRGRRAAGLPNVSSGAVTLASIASMVADAPASRTRRCDILRL